MTIYSKQLATGSATGGAFHVVFTAPADVTTVIRTITVFSETLGSDALTVKHSSGAIIFATGAALASTSYAIDGRWVLNPGETISCASGASTFTYFISGYELS